MPTEPVPLEDPSLDGQLDLCPLSNSHLYRRVALKQTQRHLRCNLALRCLNQVRTGQAIGLGLFGGWPEDGRARSRVVETFVREVRPQVEGKVLGCAVLGQFEAQARVC